MLSRKRECSQLMTEREFEEFWQSVDSSRHRRLPPGKQLRQRRAEQEPRREEEEAPKEEEDVPPLSPQILPAARSAKTARCGSCEACRAKDCGECSACRFRRLLMLVPRARVAPSTESSGPGCRAHGQRHRGAPCVICGLGNVLMCVCSLAGKNCLDKPRFGGPGVKKKACINRVCLNIDQLPSPPLRPAEGKQDSLPPIGLPDGLTRRPLLPLDSQPLAATNFYAAQTVPDAYPVGVSTKLEFLLASHGINWYR